MKNYRLDQLADGIFAIIMTLLAFDVRLPEIVGRPNDIALWNGLSHVSGTFLTFFVSFALLFTYWRAHHFIVSTYAKNLSAGLANYNALFFFLIALVPFSARFLGEYGGARVPIIFYGANVIAIGLTLYFMRRYIEVSPTINTAPVSRDQVVGGYIRILLPVFSALVAVVISLWDTTLPVIIFTFAIIFNLIPGTSSWLYRNFRLADK